MRRPRKSTLSWLSREQSKVCLCFEFAFRRRWVVSARRLFYISGVNNLTSRDVFCPLSKVLTASRAPNPQNSACWGTFHVKTCPKSSKSSKLGHKPPEKCPKLPIFTDLGHKNTRNRAPTRPKSAFWGTGNFTLYPTPQNSPFWGTGNFTLYPTPKNQPLWGKYPGPRSRINSYSGQNRPRPQFKTLLQHFQKPNCIDMYKGVIMLKSHAFIQFFYKIAWEIV